MWVFKAETAIAEKACPLYTARLIAKSGFPSVRAGLFEIFGLRGNHDARQEPESEWRGD